MQARLVSSSSTSCLILPSAGITGMHYHTHLISIFSKEVIKSNLKTACDLRKQG
jgi:hypothetical protein